MRQVVSAAEARAHLDALLRQAAEGGMPVVVERDGGPAAVLLALAEYERLLAGRGEQPGQQGEEDWLARADRIREEIMARLGGRKLPPPEDIIREMREERDAQIDAAVRDLR